MDRDSLKKGLEQLIGRSLIVKYDIGYGPQIVAARLQKVNENGLQLEGDLSLDSLFQLDFGSVIKIMCQGATILPEPGGMK